MIAKAIYYQFSVCQVTEAAGFDIKPVKLYPALPNKYGENYFYDSHVIKFWMRFVSVQISLPIHTQKSAFIFVYIPNVYMNIF